MYKQVIEDWQDFETWSEDHTVMVEWAWLDEGFCGDYNSDDTSDYPHLRFSVYKKGFSASDNLNPNPIEAIDDASYCTMMPITTSKEILVKLAKYILMYVEGDVKAGNSIKKVCERLSWIDEGHAEPPE